MTGTGNDFGRRRTLVYVLAAEDLRAHSKRPHHHIFPTSCCTLKDELGFVLGAEASSHER